MAIKYFPNRPQIARKHAIEYPEVFPIRTLHAGGDITASGLDEVFSPVDGDWVAVSVGFSFSGATSRDYAYAVINGRKVVEKYNDFLWIQTTNSIWQKITLDPGFYTGTELATELQTKLDANDEFTDLGITFTVTYDNATGVFEITPSSTQIRYVQEYLGFQKSDQQSIAGHLFGLNANTAFASSVLSDTPVQGLDNELPIISETNTALNHYNDDRHELSIDQAIKITTSTAAIDATVTVRYQEV